MVRRLVFAAPLVVTFACGHPVEHRPKRRRPIERRVEAPPPDAAPRVPRELVAVLPPLTRDRTFQEFCRRAHCNPPLPSSPYYHYSPQPSPVETVDVQVSQMQREPTGARVRISRREHMDQTWRAVFVAEDGAERGECTIVAWDYPDLDCTTPLPPEQLVDGWETFKVRMIPPPALVERIARERAQWRPPPPQPMPEPAKPPPRPQRGRVIDMHPVDDGVIIMVGVGSDLGIERSWRARLVTKTGKPVRGGDCEIVRVGHAHTVCRVKLARAQVEKAPFVVLEPGLEP